jgi:hypothetical protein
MLEERRRVIGMLPQDDVLATWLDPVEVGPLDDGTQRRLLEMGIDLADIACPWPLGRMRVAYGCEGGYTPCPVGEPALIIGVLDEGLIDLAAWHPGSCRIASRLGIGACLGQGQAGREGYGSAERPLQVWRDPVKWLRARRCGIVVVDWARAAHLLAGAVLQPEDQAHAIELTRRLRVLLPVIVAPRQVGAAV